MLMGIIQLLKSWQSSTSWRVSIQSWITASKVISSHYKNFDNVDWRGQSSLFRVNIKDFSLRTRSSHRQHWLKQRAGETKLGFLLSFRVACSQWDQRICLKENILSFLSKVRWAALITGLVPSFDHLLRDWFFLLFLPWFSEVTSTAHTKYYQEQLQHGPMRTQYEFGFLVNS